jgi:hypothetical protein
MPLWESYPSGYRASEVAFLRRAARAGECSAVIGLSGAGKSNLLGFLAHHAEERGTPQFQLVDCNRLPEAVPGALFDLLAEALEGSAAGYRELEALVARRLEEAPDGICLILDRFDALSTLGSVVYSNLRALRDRFKYRLMLVVGMRRPLDARNELAELFFANTLWLGPLAPSDALWSAGQFAQRRELDWNEAVLARLVELTWGYPAWLRASCEAHAAGCPLETAALLRHPAVQRRLSEFWADSPSPADLRASGMEGHPFLALRGAASIDPAGLTAGEQRLLDFFQAHAGEICLKDDLIRAVWPEESVAGGLRDDSLSQLVHRLRDKIEPDPAHPARIQTILGRGYRFHAA